MKLTLVLASQRSGSTLLCNDIKSLGGLGSPAENFLKLFRAGDGSGLGPQDVKDRIAAGADEQSPDVGAVKLMVNYAPRVYRFIEKSEKPAGRFEACMGFIEWARREYDAVNLIVLVRENAVDQAISRALASKTGVYHIQGTRGGNKKRNAAPAPGDSAVPPQDVMRAALASAREADVLRRVARKHANLALLLTYEQIAASPEATSQALRAHAAKAGMEAQNELAVRSMKKVVSNDVSAQIKADLRQYLDREFLRHLN
ncbi:MAG: hypothetical protein HUJ24_08780 [Rhodobacteraceae bacterium]|nr:hypothetical protein [Paracoccaceae bacterium]